MEPDEPSSSELTDYERCTFYVGPDRGMCRVERFCHIDGLLGHRFKESR